MSAGFVFPRTTIIIIWGIVHFVISPHRSIAQHTSSFPLKSVDIFHALESVGFPSKNYIRHTAMVLEYSEPHEQAKWVMHIIPPGMDTIYNKKKGSFHPDLAVKTGSASKLDYSKKTQNSEGKRVNLNFGYDRGHLAPRADFKWSNLAIEESYLFSNVSPQVKELNQRKWNQLEQHLRQRATKKKHELVILTAPVLNDKLRVIPESKNEVVVPEFFVKAVYDITAQKAIGFIMRNENQPRNLIYYATTIDAVEEKLGFDIFTKTSSLIEKKLQLEYWFDWDEFPINYRFLDKNNMDKTREVTALEAREFEESNYEILVCDYVVSTKVSKNGNVWLNLGKAFPNQELSIFIKEHNLKNFKTSPVGFGDSKQCFIGKVTNFGQGPTMSVYGDDQVVSGK